MTAPRRGGRSGAPGRGGGRRRPPPRDFQTGGKAKPTIGGEQVEGRQAVRELLLAGTRRVKQVMVANDLDEADIVTDILELAAELRVPVMELPRRKLEAEARTEAPQGVVAKAAPLQEADIEELSTTFPGRPAPFLVILDGVTDPGNLGAILRSADCAGVTGIVLPRHRSVHVTPTVTKAAAGAVEHLPIALVGGLPAAITRLRDRGVWVYGLDGVGERSIFELPTLGNEAVALVLGAEGSGLSRLVRQRCDEVVSIPMNGHLSSLNVAAAASIACFEVARRRLG
ncbi:MAG: rRNA methyltransferase [Acidimicrobiia bacterium]|nr:rRNA methyltransferase [Acidimicrobiia bacterium]